ncbi:MAG TPA: ring-cleaving dioxygenase [Gemmatimonadaceae bacterium]
MIGITGLHHVTCIAGDPQENLDFYTGLLGMRLVKKSVNQDVPGTYHLFYADGAGSPGTDLTFFPWPDMEPVSPGVGLASEVGLAVPTGSLEYWQHRLGRAGIGTDTIATRFGERVLPFADVHGLRIALIETSDARDFTPWNESPVPADRQVIGLHSMRIVERDLAATAAFLTGTLGLTKLGDEDGWHRFGVLGGGSGRFIDVTEAPRSARGRWGTGGVHHIAWRVPDDEAEMAVRERVEQAHRRPTPVIDRFWFRSVYFLEPGGVLFELATDGPGFAIDESPETLGESLVLPPWLEPKRREIEATLPPLQTPVVRVE